MCGIAGKIYLNKQEISVQDLQIMIAKIRHRGPDDIGYYLSYDKAVGLAHARLAVIDLSKKGHQPMNFQKRYWITFNGEIYNYQELRRDLIKQGIKFSSNSDTEVILALYAKYQEQCLKYLRGMFAFVIYDEKENIIFAARDRVGKKPLKYFWNGQTFIFASELKSLLTQKEIKREPDWIAINNYLTYGYVPSPLTGFKNIQKLEPGNYLKIDLNKKTLIKAQYWAPDFSQKLQLSEKEWSKKIIDELTEATRLRMISDVPIGAFLSGGTDSSAVVAMMASLSKTPVKTFTISFKEKKFNESQYAKNIVNRYHTEHYELLAEPESIEILPLLVESYEEPYANASAIVAMMVSRLARKYVTVILNGDGGDENFAGYDRYCRVKRDANLDPYLALLRPLGLPVTKFLNQSLSNSNLKRLYKYLLKSKNPLADRYISYNAVFLNEDKSNLITGELKDKVSENNAYSLFRKIYKNRNCPDNKDKALLADLSYYLPDDLLAKIDIASMGVGLEARSPILDQKFIELAAQIPFDLKLKGSDQLKYIFKKALEPYVPKENLYRAKMGFSIPLGNWFTGELNAYTKSKLFSKKAKNRKLFNNNLIKEMLIEHSLNNDFGLKLWSLLTLELWFETYFD
jgi:asparagine synthase (glutamine-hydrolysing)